MPKSSSFTWPSCVTSTLDGLRSRCTIEIGVRVRDGRQHVEEQPHARLDVEAAVVAVAIDVLALDVLEHEIRLPAGGDAGVDQPRDVRVREAREDAAFAPEALLAVAADRARRSGT